MKIKNLRGQCQHCGKPIEFHAEHAGSTAECPHCGRPTELWLATPQEEAPPHRKRAIVFFILSLVILAVGLVALRWVFLRAQSRAAPAPASERQR